MERETNKLSGVMVHGISRTAVLCGVLAGFAMEFVAVFRMVPFDSAAEWFAMVLLGGFVTAGMTYASLAVSLWLAIGAISWLGHDDNLRFVPKILRHLMTSLE